MNESLTSPGLAGKGAIWAKRGIPPAEARGKTQKASAVRAQNAETGHDQSAVALAVREARLHGEGRSKRHKHLALARPNGPVGSKEAVFVRKIVHGVPLVRCTPTLVAREGVVKSNIQNEGQPADLKWVARPRMAGQPR
tara:strand:+ start:2375 stop:2791 length:417 start_codon:yes stop_codon:yes gene_type:complete